MHHKTEIEAIYPLSPMQEGMLFHVLADPESDVYFTQSAWHLPAGFDVEALELAWRKVFDRHPVLRTAFVWKGLDQPRQVVHRRLPLPWEVHDWRELGGEDRQARLEQFLAADRQRGFELARAPLVRLSLIHLPAGDCVFVWSHSHLLLDGWSTRLVMAEILDLYAAAASGRQPRLAPSRPFKDYIVWLGQQDSSRAEAFWRRALSGFEAPTPLPAAGPSRGLPEIREPDEQTSTVDPEATTALRSFAGARGLTLNTLVQGAWALLLSHYSGHRDVVFGTTVSGRPPSLTGVESIVGLFINTLPVRVRVVLGEPVVDWLRRLQEQQAELRQYDYSPLVTVHEWSDVPGGQPLFDSLYVFENYPVDERVQSDEGIGRAAPGRAAPGRAATGIRQLRSFESSNYPLNLIVVPGPELGIMFSYDPSRFDATAIRRLLSHLRRLLDAFVAAPQQPVAEVSYLSPAEEHQLRLEWNDAAGTAPAQQCAHQLFAAQATATPDAVAVVFRDEALSYRELHRRAAALADQLGRLGVGPEVAVGLCLERSPAMVIAVLGVLEAGGTYLPLDPTYPDERLAFMLQDCGVEILISQESLAARLPWGAERVMLLDRPEDLPAESRGRGGGAGGPDPERSDPGRPDPARAENLAYVIYTSGSIGRPKGVMVSHSGVANLLAAIRRSFAPGPGTQVLQFSSLSFDASFKQLLMALATGATLHLAPASELLPGADLTRLLRRRRIDLTFLPPSTLGALGTPHLPELADLIVAGEACPREVVEHWGPGRRLWNAYGPTEATVWSTVARCQPGDGKPPIGRPLAGVEALVLDRRLALVPAGVPGELHLGGAGLARGYLGRPGRTAAAFIPHPFADEAGQRLYRTGDLVRLLANGELDFLGRIDLQVKVRGFRVELGEIEAVLATHPAVAEAVVVARRNAAGDPALVGYVKAAGETPPTAEELTAALRSRLPEYMLPSAWVLLEALPLTPSGKVDRAALGREGLPAPEQEALPGSAERPRGPVEEGVAAIFAEVLGRRQVGPGEDFFALGGHSLLATRLVSRLQQTFGVELEMRQVFEGPTVADLSRALEAALRAEAASSLPTLVRAERAEDLPLSFAQERLWFLDQLEPGSAAYNVPQAIEIQGPLSPGALAASLGAVAGRHEILRTTFVAVAGDENRVAGQPVQVIGSPRTALPVVDLGDLPAGRGDAEARRLARSEARRPFDLARGPLLRVTLVRSAPERHLLLLTMHHIVTDAWSMELLVREVVSSYQAILEGRTPPLPELDIQYADFAVWQRRWLTGEVLGLELAYWRQRLASSPTLLELPTDRPRPAARSQRGGISMFALSADLSAAVRSLCRRQGTTLFMTLLATFQALQSRLTGQTDIPVGTPIAGRNHSQTENLIGFFVNTLVLRTDLAGDPEFLELLARVREVALEAYSHQDLPFDVLATELQPERDLSHSPLFQVMFTVENPVRAPLGLEGLTLTPLPVSTGTAKFDLTLGIQDGGEELTGWLEYSRDLFDATTAERLAGWFRCLLEAAIAEPRHRISEFPLLAAAERHQVLVEWNATGSEYPRQSPLAELFALEVRRGPERTAAIFDDRALSYGELDRRANQVAHTLKRHGVGPDVLVGLCSEPCPEMVIGLVGILKAGGAYLPLDPMYPPERLALMIEDAGAQVLLTLERLAEKMPRGPRRVRLDADRDQLARESTASPEIGAGPTSLAYVIYTSGSTGVPKGVAVDQRAVTRLVLDTDYVELRRDDRVAQAANISFDAATFEIWGPLLHGAALVGFSRDVVLSPADFAAGLREQRITTVFLTTALFNQIAGEDPGAFATVRDLLFGGEAVDPSWVRAVLRSRPPRRLLHVYGPTESTTFTTWFRVEEVAADARTVPIGHPIANTRILVLDAGLRPQPIGVAGELYIGGDGLARGYLGRPALTAESFVPDALTPTPGGRLYRTGDRVRQLGDGELVFLGRADHQVKLRGFRIELSEIEAVLGDHPEIAEAAVLVRREDEARGRLVAYVAPRGAAPPTTTELRDFLGRRLPDYMVPQVFVTLERLPLTPNGKVDRRALPAPEGVRPELAQAFAAPRAPVETRLAAIWSQVLGIDEVGLDDNFFELGGDSILSIQVVARAAEAGLELSAKQLFQHPTVGALAAVAVARHEPREKQGTVIGEVPLTPVQRWFLELESPTPHHFNQALLLELDPRVAPPRLEAAVARLLEHHDALRLRFPRDGSGWRQEIAAPGAPAPVTAVDLSLVPAARRGAAVERAAAQAQGSLDLERGPLVRAVHFDLGETERCRLLLVIHHLAVDGVSWRILLGDLERSLAGGDLTPKGTSFKRWAERLVEVGGSDVVRRELPYWSEEMWPEDLADEDLRLPVDLPAGRHSNTVPSAREVTVTLGREETRTLLRDVPGAFGTRINDVLLTALARACEGWTGRSALLLDLESHGRSVEGLDLSRTVGWFTAIYPILLDLRGAGAPAAREPAAALAAVREQLKRVPGDGLGYGLLRYLGSRKTARALRALPAAELSFNYHGQVDQTLPAASLLSPAAEATGPSQSTLDRRWHLLDVVGIVAGGELRFSLTYSRNLHRRQTIEALGRGFIAALRELIGVASDVAGFSLPALPRSELDGADFPEAELSPGDLENLFVQLGRDGRMPHPAEFEAMYPLSPMQQGMLFHVLADPESGVYFTQFALQLPAGFDLEAMQLAWRQVFERHPVLRTAFVWKGLDEPRQVVHRRLPLPWEEHDWRDLGAAEWEACLEQFLAADRQQGFELLRAPLVRLSLIHLPAGDCALVWSHSHLLLDGWSAALVMREVLALYEAAVSRRPPQLSPSRPFKDYIVWLGQQDLSRAEAFWRQTLSGFDAPTPLPAGRPSRGLPELREPHKQTLTLEPDEATAPLRSFARARGLTLNTLIQGAWALVLSHHSGDRDVVFGATVSGRPPSLTGVESIVGLFINTLPVRVRIARGERVADWLAQLQEQQAELRQFEYSPLVAIHEWSDVPASQPLFDSLFAFENYPVDERLENDTGVGIRPLQGFDSSNYPLNVTVAPGRGLPIAVAYDPGRFDATAIQRLLVHLRTVLEGLVSAPDRHLAEVPILTRAERHQLLVEWNGSASEYPRHSTLTELFSVQVEQAPDRLAAIFEKRTLSYGELDRRANQIAHNLQRYGVGSDVLVGLCMEPSLEMIIAVVGILKAGAAYLPLDPSYPSERLALMMEDARVPVLLTLKPFAESFLQQGTKLVCLDADRGEIERESVTTPEAGGGPESLAYVIYTSGSTGVPKGVAVEQRAVARLVLETDYIRIFADDRIAQASNISFDAATFEIWGPLLNGATLVGLAREMILSPALLADRLREQRVTTIFLTTALFNQVAREEPAAFATLREVLFGGETVDPKWVRAVLRSHPPERLLHVYGPTESTTFTTWCRVEEVPVGAHAVPIGRPIANTRAYVLDRELRPQPIGASGELYVAGDGLAREYLRRHELTSERFVEAPALPGERLYKTGDVVCYGHDGNIEFLGRTDQQLKLRGFRIEPGEIESVLEQHPAVSQAVVLLRQTEGAEKSLVACLQVAEDQPPTVVQLRQYLKGRVPEYLVPAGFVLLDALPLNLNGKVDRKALETLEPQWQEADSNAPRNPYEELVAGIFAEVLGVEKVGMEDDFFERGGHSLLATRLVSRAQAVLGVDLSVSAVFETPTVRGLAGDVEQMVRSGLGGQFSPVIESVPRDVPIPLSFSQERLWFVDRLEPDLVAYNIPLAVRLEGGLEVEALAESLGEIVRRHEVLRTRYRTRDGRAYQVVEDAGPVILPVVDLEGLPECRREETARALKETEARRPFDLDRGPVYRARLLRLEEGAHLLLATIHHIATDGWSMGVLVRELSTLYASRFSRSRLSASAGAVLGQPPVQYADYAVWQRQWLQGEVLETELQYWRQRLSESDADLELPTDRPRPAVQAYRGGSVPVRLAEVLGGRLDERVREWGATPFMVLLAGFEALLWRYTGQRSIRVGTPVAGRTVSEVEDLIGFFVNTLVLQAEPAAAASFEELVGQVRRVALEAYSHQEVPFEKVVDALGVPRDMSRSPVFQVMFVLQNNEPMVLELEDLSWQLEPTGTSTALFDLTLDLGPGPEGIGGALHYDRDLFDRSTAERMAGHFKSLLASAVSSPRLALGELSMLRPAEHHQLRVEWNDAAGMAPAPQSAHQLFAAQAAATPDAVAVVFGDEALSYGELARQAAALADRLGRLGVGPEVLVGLCLERSPAMVIAVLGVLEAGGAYLPLDPAYPEERLAFMLRDSGAEILVSQQALAARGPASRGPAFRLPRGPEQVLLLDRPETLPAASRGRCSAAAKAENLAYVIYTSGSTGRPKGVMVSHRGVANLVAAQGRAFGPGAGTRVLQFASLSFDASFFELVMALASGATLHLAPAAELLPGADLARLLLEKRIANVTLPPSALAALGERSLPELATLVVAGETCPPELVERWAPGRRFWNGYGPTEATVCSSLARCRPGGGKPAIGRPIAGNSALVLDRRLNVVPAGVPGELHLAGIGLARGYLGRPRRTAAAFIPNPFAERSGERLYRSGDLARWSASGELEFLGRIDHQVKVRGFRIELGEIEAVLRSHRQVAASAVSLRRDGGRERLVAYVVPTEGSGPPEDSGLRSHLRRSLPEYMVPALFVTLAELPLTANGKLDRAALGRGALPAPVREELAAAVPIGLAGELAAIWRDVLGVEQVGLDDNFFDAGGHSLLLARVQNELQERLDRDVPIVDLFRFPTLRSLARHLGGEAEAALRPVAARPEQDVPIAIVAMHGRFPGAAGVEELWQNLCDGVESITFFDAEELEDSPLMVDPRSPDFVAAAGVIEGVEDFDAALFDYTPLEAEITDPQQRLFLECAWETLELAGYDPQRWPGQVGVFAGCATSMYLQTHLLTRPDVVAAAGLYQLGLGNGRDHLPTRVSYKLGLQGPAVNVQTACSTSLVAVHLACRSLRDGECDMALAGGVTLQVPQKTGYIYEPSMINSPDGHCRAFDAEARGTVGGSGVGLVALKRLPEAIADGDPIRAVIRGSAINNDGALKAGYTAPSVEGQAQAIAQALATAGVEAESIGYVEAHGTGTELGDPIEVAALTKAFAGAGVPDHGVPDHGVPDHGERGFCALGSLKTNLGHLDCAAGVAGLIKAALAVERGQIPPSLHYERPNPKIDFASSPFFVNARLREWRPEGVPRRAGVSSFGIGGTNAHAVLEEPPELPPSGPSRPNQLLLLSARTEAALEAASERLAARLASGKHPTLADVAYTLQVGRRRLEHRRAVVCSDLEDAAAALRTPERLLGSRRGVIDPPVVFLFPGQGAQHAGMARGLYEAEGSFRDEVDRCLEILAARPDLELRPLLLEAAGDGADERLRQTRLAQPALFVVEYALARLWMAWGVQPQALIGHSIGELVAACVAGVVDLEDALELVARRGELMQQAPEGSMLGIALPEAELLPLLGGDLALAAVNGPALSVVSGAGERVEGFAAELSDRGIECRPLHTSHAFHSPSMEPAREAFAQAVAGVELRPPRIPFVSNLTGTWIEPDQATDPAYWGRQLRSTVRFAAGLGELLEDPERVFLEVGPGRTLSVLLRQRQSGRVAVASMRRPRQEADDAALLLEALGRLWLAGVSVDWPAFYRSERRRRVELPTYPFERRRCWVEPGAARMGAVAVEGKRPEISEWFYLPTWRRGRALPLARAALTRAARPLAAPATVGGERRGVTREGAAETAQEPWLLLVDSLGVGAALAEDLRRQGMAVVTAAVGEAFEQADENAYHLRPDRAEDYEALFAALAERELQPARLVHLWCLEPAAGDPPAAKQGSAAEQGSVAEQGSAEPLLSDGEIERFLVLGVDSLLALAPAALRHTQGEIRITAVSSGLHRVTEIDLPHAAKAGLLGPVKVLPQEHPELVCDSIDLDHPASWCRGQRREKLLAELLAPAAGEPGAVPGIVALRGGDRWLQTLEPLPLPAAAEGDTVPLRQGGVYLITGGLGNLGLLVARHLAESVAARLVLVGRTALPERRRWDAWLEENPSAGRPEGRPPEGRPPDGRTPEDDLTRRRILELRQIEGLGGEVLLVAADVADREAMGSAVGLALQRFGDLHGVVHAAGLIGEQAFRPASTSGGEPFREQLRPKLEGLRVLDDILGQRPLDFLVVMSSLSALLGGLGFAAYGAANAAVDALVEQRNRRRRAGRWLAVDWEGWQVGATPAQNDPLQLALTPEEGIEAFRRLIAHSAAAGEERVVVSTGELETRLRHSLDPKALRARSEEAVPAAAAGGERPDLSSPFVAPSNPTEETLVGIMGEILGIDGVGVHDDFFELGGHSLLATRLLSRIRQSFGSEPTLQQVFETPTVAGLARLITETEPLASSAGPPIARVARVGDLPLSFSQTREWFLDRLEPGSSAYNLPFSVEVRGRFVPEVLRATLCELARRHEILRTRFEERQGTPVQIIEPEPVLTLAEIDLRALPEARRPGEAELLGWQEATWSFRLDRLPLFRSTLLRLGGEHWRLILNFHHIVMDGWSFDVLVQEIATLYQAFDRGRPSPLPPLAVQYADYAAWQAEYLKGETLERQLAYWRGQLGDGGSPPLELPTDRPRPTHQTFDGDRESFVVPPAVVTGLHDLARDQGASLYMVLLAALYALLRRYTGEDDLSVGTFIAGRNRPELEGLIGFFVNTLVMRVRSDGDPPFRELVDRTRRVTLDAYAHQEIPFERLLEELQPERDMSRPAYFQVMLVMQNLPQTALELGGEGEGLRLETAGYGGLGRANFDLTLWLAEAEGAVGGDLDYNVDLFEAATARRLLEHYGLLLEAVAGDAGRPLSELPLSTAEERQRVLEEWSGSVPAAPWQGAVHELFEQRARQAPEAPVLTAGAGAAAGELTYGELAVRSNRLAHRLRALGVAAEVRVALCLPRGGRDELVAVLAVLKAGGAYLPVDADLGGAERLVETLRDGGAQVLVTHESLLEIPGLARLAGDPEAPDVVCLDRDGAAIDAFPGEPPRIATAPEQAAYVIYTSGSTGRPKGVVVSHRSLASYAAESAAAYEIEPGDRVLRFASLSFDASAEEIYPTLLVGGTLVESVEHLGSTRDFLEGCAARGVTVLDLPTAYWHTLMADLPTSGTAWPTSVRLVILGGELARGKALEVWRRQVPAAVRLVNSYGPTEGTIVATRFEASGAELVPGGDLPIGQPISGARALVLDRRLEPVPVRLPGELYLAGAGVARGYLGRPRRTAASFVPDPFAELPGGRLYRTGDRVRWLEDGCLEFLGRVDDQVKVRGFRIEPGEVAVALEELPAVRQAVVLAHGEEKGDLRLVAWVVPEGEAMPEVSALRAALGDRLPDYMVPSAFVPLERLPLTSGGKVDRRALPEPDWSRPELEAEYVAPRTESEEALAEIVRELLDLDRVGVYDSFFDLGGHSLLATQFLARIRELFEVEVPLRAVFERPTVASLAVTVEELILAELEELEAAFPEEEMPEAGESEVEPG